MMADTPVRSIRILLVGNDPDEPSRVGDLLERADPDIYELHWVSNCDAGIEALSRNRHDLALVDYRLGAKTGLDCMREARALGSEIPVILLSETDD